MKEDDEADETFIVEMFLRGIYIKQDYTLNERGKTQCTPKL